MYIMNMIVEKNPGNQYKDICRGTSVIIRLPGQWIL